MTCYRLQKGLEGKGIHLMGMGGCFLLGKYWRIGGRPVGASEGVRRAATTHSVGAHRQWDIECLSGTPGSLAVATRMLMFSHVIFMLAY